MLGGDASVVVGHEQTGPVGGRVGGGFGEPGPPVVRRRGLNLTALSDGLGRPSPGIEREAHRQGREVVAGIGDAGRGFDSPDRVVVERRGPAKGVGRRHRQPAGVAIGFGRCECVLRQRLCDALRGPRGSGDAPVDECPGCIEHRVIGGRRRDTGCVGRRDLPVEVVVAEVAAGSFVRDRRQQVATVAVELTEASHPGFGHRFGQPALGRVAMADRGAVGAGDGRGVRVDVVGVGRQCEIVGQVVAKWECPPWGGAGGREEFCGQSPVVRIGVLGRAAGVRADPLQESDAVREVGIGRPGRVGDVAVVDVAVANRGTSVGRVWPRHRTKRRGSGLVHPIAVGPSLGRRGRSVRRANVDRCDRIVRVVENHQRRRARPIVRDGAN